MNLYELIILVTGMYSETNGETCIAIAMYSDFMCSGYAYWPIRASYLDQGLK